MSTPADIANALGTIDLVRTTVPKRRMKYDSQVVWVLDPADPELTRNANRLHGKRCAAGEPEKSAILWGSGAPWPAGLPKTANSRVYIVGHGAPVGTAAGAIIGFKIGIENEQLIGPKELATKLEALLAGTKVRRIGLAMCYGGGWVEKRVAPGKSFAYEFAQYCVALADDITARVDEMDVNAQTTPAAEIAQAADFVAGQGRTGGAALLRKLHTYENQQKKTVAVLTASKTVTGFNPHTYGSVIVVQPNAANPTAPSWEYRRDWVTA